MCTKCVKQILKFLQTIFKSIKVSFPNCLDNKQPVQQSGPLLNRFVENRQRDRASFDGSIECTTQTRRNFKNVFIFIKIYIMLLFLLFMYAIALLILHKYLFHFKNWIQYKSEIFTGDKYFLFSWSYINRERKWEVGLYFRKIILWRF